MSDATDQFIIVQFEGKVIKTLPLNMQVLRIGRSPENGLPLTLDHGNIVSRNHAELRMESQGPTLTDLGSANGTFIGSQRLLPNQPHVLTDGTTFRIGSFTLTYRSSKTGKINDEVLPTQELTANIPIRVEISPSPLRQARQPSMPISRRPLDEPDSLYRQYLPDIFQENDFLRRFLHIFEDIWEPLEQRQDHIAMYFDPRTCPASFLPWLASWLDIPFHTHWPEARHRRLLSEAMDMYSLRGTRYGLARMIEVCTGLIPVITEHAPFVFHIRIAIPSGASREMLDKDLIEELIQAHKPAHAGYILEVIT